MPNQKWRKLRGHEIPFIENERPGCWPQQMAWMSFKLMKTKNGNFFTWFGDETCIMSMLNSTPKIIAAAIA